MRETAQTTSSHLAKSLGLLRGGVLSALVVVALVVALASCFSTTGVKSGSTGDAHADGNVLVDGDPLGR